MIHIKLFEGFDTQDYYVNISDIEGNEYINTTNTNIRWDAGKIMDKLLPLLKGGFVIKNKYYGSFSQDDKSNFISKSAYFGRVSVVIHKYYNHHFQDFFILPLEDEYYVVLHKEWYYHKNSFESNVQYNYYKCDQWDGLVKLLKDKSII